MLRRIFTKSNLSQTFLIKVKLLSSINESQNKTVVFETDKLDKILYSSILEASVLKLGYKKNKIIENRMKRAERIENFERTKIKPFPIALQYMYGEKYEEPHEFTEDEGENFVNLPYRNVVDAADQQVQNFSNWMQDYETYDESENDDDASFYGTPDPKMPISSIPCGGCGALLHCAETSLPGYLPSQLYKGKSIPQLKTTICQRCHFLKNYNTAINVSVSPETYIKMISEIKDKYALAILMVDLLDFPCSIWPGLSEILGNKRPVFIVGNKVDLIPKDSRTYLDNVKDCLIRSIVDAGFQKNNVKHISLISAATGYGVEELITQLHKIWGTKGDVYLVGCTNVGKSSLFNALLRSDYCKVEATNLVQKATASPWPGTTLRMLKFPILRPSDYRLFLRVTRLQSERVQKHAEEKLRRDQARTTGRKEHATLIGHIGRTFEDREREDVRDSFSITHSSGFQPQILALNEKNEQYVNSKWCYDTPGVVQPDQILNLLTTEELLLAIPKEMITPRTYLLKVGMSFFLAGLGRLDYVNGPESVRIIVYASNELPTMICATENADELYREYLGTELLRVPRGNKERLQQWPALKSSDSISVIGYEKYITACDILLSSSGWIGINLPAQAKGEFIAWTPEKRGIVVRNPPLLPNGLTLRGPRVRRTLAYRTGCAFIKQ